MNIKTFKNCVCNIDREKLNIDEYVFSTLDRILNYECNLTITDNEKFVICHSCFPYPVWVYLRNDASESEKENVYLIIKETFGFDGEYTFNTSNDFAEFIMNRCKKDGYEFEVKLDLLAYRCLKTIAPTKNPEGYIRLAAPNEVDIVAKLIKDFREELQLDLLDDETYKIHAINHINKESFFLWIDANGEISGCCTFKDYGDKSSVGTVYTDPDKRRYGYASQLVYKVTNDVLSRNLTPVLYADKAYGASNKCYMKLGYELMGSICTIGKATNE